MERSVVVSGSGIVSPLGDSSQVVFQALCEGRSALIDVDLFSTELMGGLQAGEIKDFLPQPYLGKRNFRPLDRTGRLAGAAVQMTLENGGCTDEMREEQLVGLILGTMFGGLHTIAEFDRMGVTLGPKFVKPLDFANTVINAASGQTAIWHKLRGVNSTIATGGSAGLQALAYGMDLIRSGRSDTLVTGGADELCFESMYGFYRADMLATAQNAQPACPVPFDIHRNGFAQSEGAAFVLMEEGQAALDREVDIQVEIMGYGAGYDYSQGKKEDIAVTAREHAIRIALKDAHITADQIDLISASANGSILNDHYEARALGRCFDLEKIPVMAIKSALGDTLGASGAVQVVTLIESMKQDLIPGIYPLEEVDTAYSSLIKNNRNRTAEIQYALANAVSADGNCCALIVKKP